MTEYFIRSHSFAAPFFSDEGGGFVEADTPELALEQYAADYKHPAGLYAAAAYPSADAFMKGEDPLARWLCNHEIAKQEATTGKGSYGYYGHGPGDFEVDGERVQVEKPHEGRVVV